MATRTRSGPLTFADFLELVQGDQKADLIDGVFYMASPENIGHNKLVVWLTTLLQQFVEEHKSGWVTVNKVAFRLTDKTSPEPDLAFVRADRASIVKRGYIDGPPDLAIEIVSPDSVHRDYELKRERYEAAGVAEYWIIDPDEAVATFFVRGESCFVEAATVDSIFHSRVLEGFAIDTRWLWQESLPPTLPIVQAMLARGAGE